MLGQIWIFGIRLIVCVVVLIISVICVFVAGFRMLCPWDSRMIVVNLGGVLALWWRTLILIVLSIIWGVYSLIFVCHEFIVHYLNFILVLCDGLFAKYGVLKEFVYTLFNRAN